MSYRSFLSQVPFLVSMVVILGLGGFFLSRPEKEISVIAVTKNGTKLMTQSDRALREMEKVNFIKAFVKNYFNYNNDEKSKKYFKNVLPLAAPLLTRELWQNQEKPHYLKTKQMMESIEYEEKARIESIFKCEQKDIKIGTCKDLGLWRVVLGVEVIKNGQPLKTNGVLELKLKEIKRLSTEEGKWGLKIYELKKII